MSTKTGISGFCLLPGIVHKLQVQQSGDALHFITFGLFLCLLLTT